MTVEAEGLHANDNGRGPSVQVRSGGRFYLLDPRPEEIHVADIAYATSMLCRFTGHTREFYSVAQHCVIVSQVVPEEFALEGLMHDASEAYIGDISKPLKVGLDLLAPGILSGIELSIHKNIAQRYGLTWPMPPEVKHADLVALATERRDFMRATEEWADLPDPLPQKLTAWAPTGARKAFMDRYEELKR